jgi:thiamine biosynthesis protein ThiI
VTGDSLGQVASQTLDNIVAVEDAATMPTLRPLIGADKQEIVDEARRIGTFETSILPYADCCSLFVPRSPATHATVEDCRRAEEGLDVEALVEACLAEAEIQAVPRPLCGEG